MVVVMIMVIVVMMVTMLLVVIAVIGGDVVYCVDAGSRNSGGDDVGDGFGNGEFSWWWQ